MRSKPEEFVMWRRCDLHRHTTPDAGDGSMFDAGAFLQECVEDGLDVVAVTDHDRLDHVHAVIREAANFGILIVPGIEVSTDRGHVLALAPGAEGPAVLEELCGRVPIMAGGNASFERLTMALTERRLNGELFRNSIVLIGAHVDANGSLLGPGQAHSLDLQLANAQRLQALEVVHDHNLAAWHKGIKQTGVIMPILRGSDAHPTVAHQPRSTWLYLPEVTPECLRHALATHEASVHHGEHPPPGPTFWISSIRFEGGPYDGRRIDFSPRANALIGPPSSGKSLVIDAIRYVFDLPCAIDDVRSSIERRLGRCLPVGTTVVVEITSAEGQRELRRVRGGTSAPDADEKPIVFSQAELARRSMEPVPSVALLDVHCPQGARYERQLDDVAGQVRVTFNEIVTLATDARHLREEVENDQEGLEATRSKFRDLVGDEARAGSLGDLGRVENWHRTAKERLEAWRETFQVPDGPLLPSAPPLETDIQTADYIPTSTLSEALEGYRRAVRDAADGLVAALHSQLDERAPNVAALREDIEAGLGPEQHATADLAAEAERYRARLADLEQKAAQLTELDQRITEGLDALNALIDDAVAARDGLRQVRRDACTAVNESMPSFFVRLNRDNGVEQLDALLGDLRTGTYLHDTSVRAVRDTLDRKAFVRAAIEHRQHLTPVVDEPVIGASDDARRIAQEAMDRGKYDSIAQLAVLWPSDGIEILQRHPGDEPVPFDSLTEGLKALAIKEISFAASQFPAVTDQPEDAVPTTAVFENLVPTVRAQRASRQFIIASHDANVVVSGDMERVIVLPARASEEPTVGTLFDAPIREHAIALLEGGDRAFELRRRRYGEYR